MGVPTLLAALGHVPFEEAQEGEGKSVVAGGGRKDGVKMGISFLDPIFLVGIKTSITTVGSCCVSDKPSRERKSTIGKRAFQRHVPAT
jgi:hypothetical protein